MNTSNYWLQTYSDGYICRHCGKVCEKGESCCGGTNVEPPVIQPKLQMAPVPIPFGDTQPLKMVEEPLKMISVPERPTPPVRIGYPIPPQISKPGILLGLWRGFCNYLVTGHPTTNPIPKLSNGAKFGIAFTTIILSVVIFLAALLFWPHDEPTKKTVKRPTIVETQETEIGIVKLIVMPAVSLGFFAALIVIYFGPAIIARKKRHGQGVLVVNLFLGWTFLGWVLALAWACCDD